MKLKLCCRSSIACSISQTFEDLTGANPTSSFFNMMSNFLSVYFANVLGIVSHIV